MSSSQSKNKETKRMSSITNKLHNQLIRGKMGANLAANIFLFAAIFVLWIIKTEIDELDEIVWYYDRFFTTRREGLTNLQYVVKYKNEILIEENAFDVFIAAILVVAIAVFFQYLGLLFSYYAEHRRIKKILSPINDMAIQLDELTKMPFDETKFHIVEDAIEHISPEQTTELSLGDTDLLGIEAAMNNMLRKMHDTYMQQARFVNDASHELRTPISVIKGYANMLDRWGKEDEEILDESIKAIKNESDHMNHLVEQLLFLARGDAGRNTMNFENVKLNDVMREIYEESLMIDESHVYRYEEKNENVYMNVDSSMIKQAMRILVDNAAKYTNEGDEILLSVGVNEEGRPFMKVQDSGMGMAEADVKHMFERFYRADDTRKVQGTGLGLSIAKWIVDKHNGHFEILSRKDIGTRISIVF